MTDQQAPKFTRQNVSSGTTWETVGGYSRAVRVGPMVWVSGTTATDDNMQPVGLGDPYQQAIFILRKIERALNQVGASLSDIVRTRVFLANVDDWEQVAKAHNEIFETIRPVNTMIGNPEIIGSEYLVEIEVDAYIIDQGRGTEQ
jgi:enamine deaminase RidA (YjgF/YER057c/UK114 family)